MPIPTPIPIIIDTINIHYGEKGTNDESNKYVEGLDSFNLNCPTTVTKIFVYLNKSMENDHLSLDSLDHIVDLTFLGGESSYAVNFNFKELYGTQKINTLTFNSVKLKLITEFDDQRTDKPTQCINLSKLVFTGSTTFDAEQFASLNLQNVKIEFENMEMFKEFSKFNSYESTVETDDISVIRIQEGKFNYNDIEGISSSIPINLRIKKDFKLEISSESTASNLNFEFVNENSNKIVVEVQGQRFNGDHVFGIILDNSNVQFKFEINEIPSEIKGSGKVELSIPEQENTINLRSSVTPKGDLSIIVPTNLQSISIPSILINQLNTTNSIMALKEGSSTAKLLASHDYAEIVTRNLEIAPKTKSEIHSSTISDRITIEKEAHVTFTDISISCPIDIFYGEISSSELDPTIIINDNSDDFNPKAISLFIFEHEINTIDVIKGSESIFSMDKCNQIKSITTVNNTNNQIECKLSNGEVILSIIPIIEKVKSDGTNVALILGIVLIALIVVAAIILIVIFTMKNQKIKKSNAQAKSEAVDDADLVSFI